MYNQFDHHLTPSECRRHKHLKLQRHLKISCDGSRPRRVRTRSARYAAALAEQLGIINRPKLCQWCHHRNRLERHHWDYYRPLEVIFLCAECHIVANGMT